MSDAGEKLRKAHLAISSEETLQPLLTTFLSISTRALLPISICRTFTSLQQHRTCNFPAGLIAKNSMLNLLRYTTAYSNNRNSNGSSSSSSNIPETSKTSQHSIPASTRNQPSMDNAELEKLLPQLQPHSQQPQQDPHQPYQYFQDLLHNLHDPQARQALLQAFQDPQVLQTFLDSNPDLLRRLQLADHQAEDNYILTHGPAFAIWLSMLLASFVLTAWNKTNTNDEARTDLAAQDQHGSLAARLALNLRMGCLTLALNWACCEVLDAMATRAPSGSWQRQVFITLRCSVLSVLMVGMSVAVGWLSD
ncbi:hypothetical protein LTR32_002527 [Rachicladosporium monterosium]|uniref:Uncharacterized protein n=1 Tax=Rachicladosporium monterosium TaxID=1507873 RepID=A0ABR0LA12_9PEZI|nr:hypothetical protein LTR32_002527 [Rachicladosporium monterosium]